MITYIIHPQGGKTMTKEAIRISHKKAGLVVTNFPNLEKCKSELIARSYEWERSVSLGRP